MSVQSKARLAYFAADRQLGKTWDAVAGCTAGSGQPEPYVTEDGDTVTICAPIVEKDDSYPGRWAFGFDPYNGGWLSVPVSEADFERHRVGDWVLVQQRVGDVAEVGGGECAR